MSDSVFVRHLPQVLQLVLAAAVVHLYSIENDAFARVFDLMVAGFAINLVVPAAFRLQFFVGLSLVGAVLTLGVADAAWLIGTGAILIGICHLPVPARLRVAAAILFGLALAVARSGWFAAPWSSAVWPILGSMFMFRLALYMHATFGAGAKSVAPTRGPWSALAYFFMLPNLVFPLFPVVDYQTFVRTYYDRDAKAIYEQGLSWIARGLVHLLLYRVVYQRFLTDPADLATLGDVVQHMLSTFLLYLRVSGQFHLIVGMLYMFGFRLPETHKLYYLAHSFTELWRRINIYWTDFMMKLVFYPTYFRLKKLGPVRALVVSTVVVFIATWLLHSYQWFWLRGGFPLTPQDTVFWALLGFLVITGAVGELKTVKKPAGRRTGWSARMGLRSVSTFAGLCFLWSLWSAESVGLWFWSLSAASNVDARGILLIALPLSIIFALGGRDWAAAPVNPPKWMPLALSPATRTAVLLLALTVIGLPVVKSAAGAPAAKWIATMQATGLNALDTARQHRGYYEQLDVRGTQTAIVATAPQDLQGWTQIRELGVVHERRDFVGNDLQPSWSGIWNGKRFSTNRWGMRDQDYETAKPADTLRIALLGPSHVMGDNVPDDETFEAIVERRLNAEFRLAGYRKIEILNFALPAYSSMQQLGLLEERALQFAPDIIMATYHVSDRELIERRLDQVIRADVQVSYVPIATLLEQAGLSHMSRGSIPMPFEFVRTAAGRIGLDTRMPHGELTARLRAVSPRVQQWSYQRIVEVAREHGARPVILALNVVLSPAPREIPNRDQLAALNVPTINLFDVYPDDRVLELRVAPWDDHPNAEAHRLIADRLYPHLTQLLSAQPVSTPTGRSRSRSQASTEGF